MRKIAVAALVTMVGALSATTAQADAIEEIKSRGKLICGTMGTYEPYSFKDSNTQQTIGYEADLCNAIAKALEVDLEFKLLAVEARIPELTQGRVDILAAA